MTLRQLQPDEQIRVVIDGAAVNATVARQPDDRVYYRFFSDGMEHNDHRDLCYPQGEEQRLINRLRNIADDAMRSMRQIQEELKEVSHV